MGNHLFPCHRTKEPKETPIPIVGPPQTSNKRAPLSPLYIACREGDLAKVEELLPALSLGEIDRIESNKSTALHAACYYNQYAIAKVLLEAGASRSINNGHDLTPFEEAASEEIQLLFCRVQRTSSKSTNEHRFTGSSGRKEWIFQSGEAVHWKQNLYRALRLEKSFEEMIDYLRKHYLTEHVTHSNLSGKDQLRIEQLFEQAAKENDVRYVIRAYTSTTLFYHIVNEHFAEIFFRFFRWNDDERHPNTLEKSIGYLASMFIYHPDLRSLSFTGETYRGVRLSQHDLSLYTVGKRLLNKSFLSTSTNREVAEAHAGFGNSKHMRRDLDDQLIQFIVLCTYRILNSHSALNIGSISEVPGEQEVLIMPLCAFRVASIRQNENVENRAHVEIELIECGHQDQKIPRIT